MLLSSSELKDFLDEKHDQYNRSSFIESDPIQIAHQYSRKEDIEIMAFFAATIAWGQRKTIIANAQKLADSFGESPYDFILNANEKQINSLSSFKHRTFQKSDLFFFFKSMRNIYKTKGGMEPLFASAKNIQEGIFHFRTVFLETHHERRSEKHLSNPMNGSAAKRLNMYLRWMVRRDKRGIDFGIWNSISPSILMLPLDVHTGNVGRKLGLLKRKQNDWKAVEEISGKLSELDPTDPIKYDFALFGLGAFESF